MHRFYYEEHACPVNFLRGVKEVIYNKKLDPHGVFKVVAVVDRGWEEDLENATIEKFEKLFNVEFSEKNKI